ncbi:DUF4340 domain-containing protein [bacterium]|nr:DUF4340 domain-containing protein [bacterium]
MKQRRLIITTAIFGVLLIYVLITQTGNKGFNTLKLPVLPVIVAEEMEKIEIALPDVDRLEFAKKESGWQIVEPIEFPADKNKLEALQRMLAELRLTDMITENTDREADYNLTTATAISVMVSGSKDQKLELSVGSANAGATHTFIRRPGDSKVYQVLGDVTQQLTRPAREWRSLQVYDFSTDQVLNVTISQKGKKPVIFSKTEEIQEQIVKDSPRSITPSALPARTIWRAEDRTEPLGDPKVNQFLNAFTRLTAAKISNLKDWPGKPLASVQVKTLNTKYVLEFLEFQKKDKLYLIRRFGEGIIYELPEYQGKNLLKELKDF